MPQLDVSTYSSQLFWLFVSFILLYLVVRGLTPRLRQVAAEREGRVNGDIRAAEAARSGARDREAWLAERIAKAQDAARAEHARVAEDASAKAQAVFAELDARLQARIAEGEARIAAARTAAEAELEGSAHGLAAEIVQRLTGQPHITAQGA